MTLVSTGRTNKQQTTDDDTNSSQSSVFRLFIWPSPRSRTKHYHSVLPVLVPRVFYIIRREIIKETAVGDEDN